MDPSMPYTSLLATSNACAAFAAHFPCVQLRCIGATTLDEYRQYIEKDPALER